MKLVVIRPLRLNEISTVVAMLTDAYSNDRWGHIQTLDKEKLLQLVVFMDRHPDGYVRVIEVENEVVGFGIAEKQAYLFSNEIFATEQVFYIKPERRELRTVFAIYKDFERWAKAEGCREIVFTPQLRNSKKVLSLAVHFGFHVVGYVVRKLL